MSRLRTIVRRWDNTDTVRQRLVAPRHDLVVETQIAGRGGTDASDTTKTTDATTTTTTTTTADTTDDLTFDQATGPFRSYARRLQFASDTITETTTYRLSIPWFGWLFAWPVRHQLRRQRGRDQSPWWAPPDQLTERQALVLGLLAALAMVYAFTNTLFTQTVNFAADDFGVSNTAVGVAGAVVRAGIVLTIPLAVMSDRLGRRRIIGWAVWIAPIVSALGAIAPTFATLVATQAVARPLGLVLDFLVAVVLAEEMPRNSRAYAVAVTAMAAAFGAGFAVTSLPLADLGPHGWRFVYLVSLIWLAVAYDATRRLPESMRFKRPHRIAPPIDWHRFGLMALIAVAANLFVAPASFFQNKYLADVRLFDASRIALFTVVTATPAGLGFAIGGRLADQVGRRLLVGVLVPIATALLVTSFAVDGAPMWVTAFLGALLAGSSYPALAVYRAELFPTGNRGRAAGLLTVAALLGGIVGLLVVGALLDAGWSYFSAMALVAIGELLVAIVVVVLLPETAHRSLEDLNPEDLIPLDL